MELYIILVLKSKQSSGRSRVGSGGSLEPTYSPPIFMGYFGKIDKISKKKPYTFIHMNPLSRNAGPAFLIASV